MYSRKKQPKTVLELKLAQFSASIRSEPDWRAKLEDEAIACKWRRAAAAQGLPDSAISYALAELRFLAHLADNPLDMTCVDGVCAAYPGHIPPPLRQQLVAYINQHFRSIPQYMKDWHPWSDNQVLDSVHPVLHCFVPGVTNVTKNAISIDSSLNSIGAGHVPKSDKMAGFQLLPSKFEINEDGCVLAKSYINNLHPFKHAALYRILCAIMERFLPLLSLTLQTEFLCNPRMVPECDWYEEDDKFEREEYDYHAYKEWEKNRTMKPLVFPEFDPPELPDVDFRKKMLQVIVKLASIELTPEKPIYTGGSWHVEGTSAESIVATGIYYFDSENVTDTALEFRHALDDSFRYPQNDDRGVELLYGLRSGGPLNQYLGSVTTSEDLCLCFCNDKQHRVKPFELQDKSKGGHRQILVFFFVDPEQDLLSTANVPPQQADWYVDALRALPGFRRLPEAVLQDIANRSGNVRTRKEAVRHREELMKSRKFEQDEITKDYFERVFTV